MEPVFSRPYCKVAPLTAGGWLVAGSRRFPCLVQIVDGELVITEAPETLIDRAQVSAVELLDARAGRNAGDCTVLRLNSDSWCIDFSSGVIAEMARSVIGLVKLVLVIGVIQAVRRGRKLNREFGAALVSQGVIDRRKGASHGTEPRPEVPG